MTHQQRVVEEKRNLDEKLEKLREFIFYNPKFKSMRAKERQLLIRQKSAMTAYSHELRDRLETFESEDEE